MKELIVVILSGLMIGGLYYFWHRCQIFAVSKLTILMGILIWPIGMIVGIYWAIKDFIQFRNQAK